MSPVIVDCGVMKTMQVTWGKKDYPENLPIGGHGETVLD